MQKVLNPSDVYCLYQKDHEPLDMVIIDTGIFMNDGGSWEPGIQYLCNAKIQYTPYDVFYGLMRTGQIWKKGSENIAKMLRKSKETPTH